MLTAFLIATTPPPPSLLPFMDEEVAGKAFTQHMQCLGRQTHERRNDTRPSNEVAAGVVQSCSGTALSLRSALTDVYRRKPSLLPSGKGADEAAALYVIDMNARAEYVVDQARKHR